MSESIFNKVAGVRPDDCFWKVLFRFTSYLLLQTHLFFLSSFKIILSLTNFLLKLFHITKMQCHSKLAKLVFVCSSNISSMEAMTALNKFDKGIRQSALKSQHLESLNDSQHQTKHSKLKPAQCFVE